MGCGGSKNSSSAKEPSAKKGQSGGKEAGGTGTGAAAAAGAGGAGADGSSSSRRFNREFHDDSPVWVFKKGTPAIWEVYRKLRPIGERGYYGKAYVAEHQETGETVVVKKINKRRHGYTARMMDAYRKEIHTLDVVSHKHVIGLVDAFENRENLYIVMELASGGELYDRILQLKNYTEKDAAAVFRQVLEGVQALHSQNIGHFDLKPSNCVFSGKTADADIKIIDFGMARFWQAQKREKFHTPAGTVQYSAPEVVKRDYNLAADMWSVGVMLYVALVGFPPFYDNPSYHLEEYNNDQVAAERASNRNIKKKILAGFVPEQRAGYGPWFSTERGVPQLSEPARDIIGRLLEADIARRATAEEALSHPFFNGGADGGESLSPLVFDALRKYSAFEHFQQEVLELMTTVVADSEMKQLEATFEAIDKNGDGVITIEEFREAMEHPKWAGSAKDEETIKSLFDMADVDKNGALDYDEVLKTIVQLKLVAKEERLYEAFQRLDEDGNGLVTPEELQSVLELEKFENAQELMTKVDKSNDGRIDYDEFLSVWRSDNTNKF